MERKKRLQRLALFLLIVLHFVGSIGMAWEKTRPVFQLLTPLNLCLSLGVLGYFHEQWHARFIYWAVAIFLGGYFVEVLGVKTGMIFGTYAYGATLGPKLWEVPPMMGVNWLILIYCTGIISQNFSSNLYLNATLGATLMVLIDLLIEPAAMALDFWDWEASRIPTQNYLAWAGISWIMLFAFHRLEGVKKNPLAFPLYLIQLLFFALSLALASAQNWGGGLALGLNASQIDGDFAGGFNRAGISIGGFVDYQLNPNFELQPEILFEQLGSGDEAGLIVKLNYISMPVLGSFTLPIDLGDSKQEIQFYVGPVVGLLLGSKDINNDEVLGLEKIDVRGMAGLGYRFGDVSLTLRYAYSITPIAGRSSGIPLLQAGARGLFHNYVSFSLRIHLI